MERGGGISDDTGIRDVVPSTRNKSATIRKQPSSRRHCRDVILSCYRRVSQLNYATQRDAVK